VYSGHCRLDKDQFLRQVIEDLIEEFLERQHLPERHDTQIPYSKIRKTIARDFEFAAEHAEFLRVMLGERGVWGFVHALQEYHYQASLRRLTAIQGTHVQTNPEVEIVLRHLSASIIGVIQWWLEQDMPYTPDQMASKLMRIYQDGVYRCLGYELTPSGFAMPDFGSGEHRPPS
jgi:hypothetical protein